MEVKNKKMRMIKICLLLFTVVLLSCSNLKISKITSKPKNIVLIVADDLGWTDLACYGNKFIETPNLDALAKRGILFKNAYAAAPLCSPTRASIITGNNPARINLTEHLHGYTPASNKQKLITPKIITGLPPQLTTIAEALKANNYATGHFGKWHLGTGESSPAANGYDVVYGGGAEGLPKTFFYPFFWGKPYKDLLADTKEGDYLDDALTTKALSFIGDKKDSKFFISLNFYAPHVPIEGKPSLVKKYEDKRAKTNYKGLPENEYAAMVENIDYNVGRVIKYLEDNNLMENTVIMFTSDNGGLTVEEVPAFAKYTPPTTNSPLKGGKGYLYEGGIREPFIYVYPNARETNIVDNETIITTDDIFNTCMQFAGVAKSSPDGMSIFENLNKKNKSRTLYWNFPHYSPQHGLPGAAIRQGDYKLIEWAESGETVLYNLRQDIGETTNIAAQNPVLTKQLKEKLARWKKDIGAKETTLNPNYNR